MFISKAVKFYISTWGRGLGVGGAGGGRLEVGKLFPKLSWNQEKPWGALVHTIFTQKLVTSPTVIYLGADKLCYIYYELFWKCFHGDLYFRGQYKKNWLGLANFSLDSSLKYCTSFEIYKPQAYKMAKHTQTIRRLFAKSCLSVFDQFEGLALKRLLSLFKLHYFMLNSSCKVR